MQFFPVGQNVTRISLQAALNAASFDAPSGIATTGAKSMFADFVNVNVSASTRCVCATSSYEPTWSGLHAGPATQALVFPLLHVSHPCVRCSTRVLPLLGPVTLPAITHALFANVMLVLLRPLVIRVPTKNRLVRKVVPLIVPGHSS